MESPKVQTVKEEKVEEEEEAIGEEEPEAVKEGAEAKGSDEAPALNDVKESLKDVEDSLMSSFGPQREETNFTWEHYFVTHCGVLPEDAVEYEKHLIAHRLSPEDTLLESLGLIIEYGRIPIGDKLKITKALKRQTEAIDRETKSTADAAKTLGLEKYSEFEASIIMEFALGNTDEWAIDYGIDRMEDAMEEIKKMSAVAMLTNPQEAKKWSSLGAETARLMNDPVLRLLRSLGYTTFDYTKGKSVEPRRALTQPVSSSSVSDLVLGNLDYQDRIDREDRAASTMGFYS